MAYLENDVVRLAFVPEGTAEDLKAEIASLNVENAGPDTENIRLALQSIEIIETDEELTDMQGQPAMVRTIRLSEIPEFAFRQKMAVDNWAAKVDLMRLFAEDGVGLVPTTQELRLLALLYPIIKLAVKEVTGKDTQVMPTAPKLSTILRK